MTEQIRDIDLIKQNKPIDKCETDNGGYCLFFDEDKWDQVVKAAERMNLVIESYKEQVQFWQREFELELAHTRHSEEQIMLLESVIREMEEKKE